MTFRQASYHNALLGGEVLPFSPQLRLKGDVDVGFLDLPFGCPAGGTVLSMAHSLGLDIEAVHPGQSGDPRQGGEHSCPGNHQLHNWLHKIQLPSGSQQSSKQKRKKAANLPILWKTQSLISFLQLVF